VKRKAARRKQRRLLLKPIPPEKYNRVADLQAFHKFMNEGTLYVKQGGLTKDERVDRLSHYLVGRAYHYYTREVSLKSKKPSLSSFFKGLFNHCFPVNFRNKQCQKLDNFAQGNKSVRDYASELTELFTIVGTPGEREQVTKLWYGFCKSIQKALYATKLNPETSQWKEVIREVEYHELAECYGTASCLISSHLINHASPILSNELSNTSVWLCYGTAPQPLILSL